MSSALRRARAALGGEDARRGRRGGDERAISDRRAAERGESTEKAARRGAPSALRAVVFIGPRRDPLDSPANLASRFSMKARTPSAKSPRRGQLLLDRGLELELLAESRRTARR